MADTSFFETYPLSMGEFYHNLGFVDYPFNLYTAENEEKYASEIFVHPNNYESIKESFDCNRSMIIHGNRGTGKTALMYDLMQSIDDSKQLKCLIDDYSEIEIESRNYEYYRLIITRLVSTIFQRLVTDKKRLRKLSKGDKLFLSALLSQYTNQTTKDELTRKIESIQLSPVKRFVKNNVNFIRTVVNYGLNAALNIANDVLRNHYSYLPPVNENEIRDICPVIDFSAETSFNSVDATYNMLMRVCSLIKKLGYEKIVVFFDKFDEDNRMGNNAETIADFFAPLLVDNKLLENTEIQLIISVWEVPYKRKTEFVRTQKHYCPMLSWTNANLISALNKRLNVFSKGRIMNCSSLFQSDTYEKQIHEILSLSNGNPRDLWHIFDKIIQAQYEIDSSANILSSYAIEKGLDDFVKTFNLYEYYPRKPKAKANTMDVYSYIKHLLKLSSGEFTKNQLNEQAKIGSSIHNYVVGMENIGLIINTNEKRHGGVVYRINDPKVEYARKHHLEFAK